MTGGAEASARFGCFGSTCAAVVSGDGAWGRAPDAVATTRRRLLAWHRRFSRFEATSELSRLNADPRTEVPVSGPMASFVAVILHAVRTTGGLVDATLLRELEVAGYVADLRTSVPLPEALALAPPRRPAGPSPSAGWRRLRLDPVGRTVTRPPGLALDSGGLAKGLAADVLASALGTHASFAVDCAGDLRVGGAAGVRREVLVASPFDGETLHAFELADAGVATSGIGRRSWLDAGGAPAHHLLDPATGRPAFTGVVQATALAPSATEAELRAKAAVLSGPEGARDWLPHGGVVVLDDGRHEVVDPCLAGAAAQ
ncbi:MAG: FAD:protein transferase [Solirubrobacteraceae bacterium]|jgi:thiamine biosynthesis lipoprotein|nr:FAD:protein transferase [Solirubrobacteraceae bacterium]